MSENKVTGAIGERYAAEYLQSHGFRIIEMNANSRWGELDIVAEKEGKIIFVEVKTRSNTLKGKPYEAVSYGKLKRVYRTIQHYILVHELEKRAHRLDVIGIVLNPDKSVQELKHFENVGF
ncbi:YraN family protein [Candidatus Roizmanbacteria bacterium CG_4_9_14_0_2_um_filter_39_13]|uniref:UPF0102 protein CO051_05145 n=1 Tax=Candidatus Roizmanbacteria bacterium CG_4_9_14_0_2_um_filter_39_13 TaxID=1974839 RepID=A0A2M8EXF6_9BACT|nr:MAG: YraN family protein [Candidatus Roizmanbacteria bacterium CG_4_9_14_0_2_um_filter_39_13]